MAFFAALDLDEKDWILERSESGKQKRSRNLVIFGSQLEDVREEGSADRKCCLFGWESRKEQSDRPIRLKVLHDLTFDGTLLPRIYETLKLRNGTLKHASTKARHSQARNTLCNARETFKAGPTVLVVGSAHRDDIKQYVWLLEMVNCLMTSPIITHY